MEISVEEGTHPTGAADPCYGTPSSLLAAVFEGSGFARTLETTTTFTAGVATGGANGDASAVPGRAWTTTVTGTIVDGAGIGAGTAYRAS